MSLRRLSFARRAVFDLEHLDTLSDAPSIALLVSERTKHLLNNLVIADIQDATRYATEMLPETYVPLTPSDSEYVDFQEIVERAKIELDDLMPTLLEWFEQFDNRANPESAQTAEEDGIAGGDDPFILNIGPVPSDKLWRVSLITSQLTFGTFSQLYHSFQRGDPSYLHTIDGPFATLGQSPFQHTRGDWWLQEGDYVRAYWYGASTTLNAALRIAYSQYVMPF